MDNNFGILIIDNDTKSCGCLSDLLRAFGFPTECVGGLDLAKTLLLQKTYHAILLDLWTDRRKGDNLLSLLKEYERADPVIMMSDLADDDLWVHCLNSGAVDLLFKPVQADLLKHALSLAANMTRLPVRPRQVLKSPQNAGSVLT